MKLYQTKYSARAWQWFSIRFENTLVNLVYRRMDIRMVRLCRSTWDVLTLAGFGLPSIHRLRAPVQIDGLYLCSGLWLGSLLAFWAFRHGHSVNAFR